MCKFPEEPLPVPIAVINHMMLGEKLFVIGWNHLKMQCFA